MNNKMKYIAKLFDKEINEEFIVDTPYGDYTCMFTNEYLAMWSNNGQTWERADGVLTKLINGYYSIKITPWKPKKGNTYFIPCVDSRCKYKQFCWVGSDFDELTYSYNVVCKTKKEAIYLTNRLIEIAKSR